MNTSLVRYEMPGHNVWEIPEASWDAFIESLKVGGARFRQSRTDKAALQSLYSSGRASILYDEVKKEIVAHTAFWPALSRVEVPTRKPDWNEIGTVWVHEAYSGNGFARLMITSFSDRVKKERSNAFLISDKPALIHIMQTLGWKKADEVMERCILCDIAPEEDGSPRVKKPESEIWFWVSE